MWIALEETSHKNDSESNDTSISQVRKVVNY
jgi:hypothetical protein